MVTLWKILRTAMFVKVLDYYGHQSHRYNLYVWSSITQIQFIYHYNKCQGFLAIITARCKKYLINIQWPKAWEYHC